MIKFNENVLMLFMFIAFSVMNVFSQFHVLSFAGNGVPPVPMSNQEYLKKQVKPSKPPVPTAPITQITVAKAKPKTFDYLSKLSVADRSGYLFIKSKKGVAFADYAYNLILQSRKEGYNFNLSMIAGIIQHENTTWDNYAKHRNDNGTWDCGLTQQNKKRACNAYDFNPYNNLKQMVNLLKDKNKMAKGNMSLTVQYYNGIYSYRYGREVNNKIKQIKLGKLC